MTPSPADMWDVMTERDRFAAERDEARAENARLRAALERIANETWTSDALTVSGFARKALRGTTP